MTMTLKLGRYHHGEGHALFDEDGHDIFPKLQVHSIKVDLNPEMGETMVTLVCYMDNVEVEVDGNIKVVNSEEPYVR